MKPLSQNARMLGLAGLLPQIAALIATLRGGPAAWTALPLAYAYAALIFSFLGGVWWGLALATPHAPRWTYAAAVLPSLIALTLWSPWMFGEVWPGPEMVVLGAAIAASPLVDRAIGFQREGWIMLRWQLSLGLGGLTLAIGLIGH